MIRRRTLPMFAFILFAASTLFGQNETRLLRFPALHSGHIVFTYAGDLFTVPATGGVARRLTTDVGYEAFARFSPDGKDIAFTAQYDGNTEVYRMPASGGTPIRLTFTATLGRDDVSDRMGPNNIVMAWRDTATIVYRSRAREWNDFIGQLFSVPRTGGLSEQLPLPRGGFCSFSPDGKKMAYNRVFREFRTWKRYRGGQADDIWIYDFATKTTTNITNNPAQDIIPMWAGSKIYFASDRDDLKKMNLYAYDLTTQQTSRVTNFTEFDVKFPSLGDDAIVFENGGWIYRLDLATGLVQKVPIVILEDFDSGRGGLRSVSRDVSNYEISPDGNRALFGARGDVFTVPHKNGNTRNITSTSGIHERDSKWSPDGKWISYISDATGEDEIYIEPQDGSGPPVQVTSGGNSYKYLPLWSPDSRKLLWGDRQQRLLVVDIASKSVTTVATSTRFEITDYAWGPDSKWVAYSRPEEKRLQTIQLYNIETRQTVEVTDGWFTSSGPAFSPDGKYLYFISSRTYNPIYGNTEWNHVYTDMANIYLVTLGAAVESPFKPRSDEVKIKPEPAEDGKEKKEEKGGKKKSEGVTVRVDAEGLPQRIVVLPIGAANYRNLSAVGDKLFYLRSGRRDEKPKLLVFNFEKQKETELGEVNGFEISADGKKMLVSSEGAYAIIDLPNAKIDMKERLDLSDMKIRLDRRAEWNQIFHEVWRQMRDFVYDPNLHGVDWPAMKQRYAALLPYVQHRLDLTYVMGEMIAELNVGHAYIGGGDYPKPERIPLGLLGATVTKDKASGYFKITGILKGQNWDKNLRSPLTEIGVQARVGDFILSIDGLPTGDMPDLYEHLVGKAGKQVTLQLNSRPEQTGSRTVVMVPTDDEHGLVYYTWVQENMEKVNRATDNRVGYIHIPDMGVGGLNEFAKYFYPQFAKEGLIVDVRGNGGGNVSPQIIERLRREIAMISVARNTSPTPDPGGMIRGPKVMLLNEFSASDGDIVAYRFKKYGLGPVVGKRSWGGVVGIRGSLPLLDGGYLNKPEFSRYDVDGTSWIMEGVGVEPDIVVDNDPAREFAGTDDQLNKAIAIVLDELKKNPVKIAPPPPYPNKSR